MVLSFVFCGGVEEGEGRGSGRIHLDGHIVALGRVEQLSTECTTSNLAEQQTLLLLDLLEHALVLLRTTRQIGQHLLNWTVGYVLVSRVASLTYKRKTKEREGLFIYLLLL